MPTIAVYDACVLHPAPLRDLLIRLAMAGLVRARWSETILDECIRSILERRPDLDAGRLGRTRELMTQAVPDCIVRNHADLIDGLALPDPDDRHVLAAAIRCGAGVIVTSNLADFPADALAAYDLEARHPDDFVLGLVDEHPGTVAEVVRRQAAVLRNPPSSVREVLDTLENCDLPQAVAALKEFLEP